MSVQETHTAVVLDNGDEFQYILCVGSSKNVAGTIREDLEFQYILCVGSSKYQTPFATADELISIHLMCRFKAKLKLKNAGNNIISIHLMCRFKFS